MDESRKHKAYLIEEAFCEAPNPRPVKISHTYEMYRFVRTLFDWALKISTVVRTSMNERIVYLILYISVLVSKLTESFATLVSL